MSGARTGQRWRALAAKLAHALFGEYAWYRIYARAAAAEAPARRSPAGIRFETVDAAAVAASADAAIAAQASYCGPGAQAYAALSGPRIVAFCCFWHGERYRARNFWPLGDGEAKLVQVVTLPELRGRGIATDLIAHATSDIGERGFRRVYARVWHSNVPSRRAFAAAGFAPLATVIEVFPLGRARPIRITLPARRGH